MDELDDFFGNDEFDRGPSPEGEEAIEVNPGTSDDAKLNELFDKGVIKPKRTMNPRLVLNERLLVGPKGIPALKEVMKDFKPNLKADPYANLKELKKKYAYWGHLMFPKMKADDILTRCEILGTRRQVKVFMMKTRLGMNITDEDFEEESKKTKAKSSSKKRKSMDIIDDGADDDENNGGTVRDESDDDDSGALFGSQPKKEDPKKKEDTPDKPDEIENFEEMEAEAREDAEDEILADFDVNNDW